MTMTNEKTKAARAALAEAIDRRTEARATFARANEAHEMAKSILSEASSAVSAFVERETTRSASASAELAAAIRSGGAATVESIDNDLAERAAAERHAAIALGASNALADDMKAAQKAVTEAQVAVDAAAKNVLLAHRDAIAAELTAAAARYLDLRHTLGGLLAFPGIPGTALTAVALASVERDYPMTLHPQTFTAKAWSELHKALLDDSDALYVPIEPRAAPERVDPTIQRQRELRAAEDAERATNAEKLAVEMKGYTAADAMADRYERILSGGTNA